MRRAIWATAIALVFGACGGGDDEGAGASLACHDFRSTAQDQTDGLLTGAELRDRLQDINGRASVSEEPAIVNAGRDMLAAITAGDDAELASAVRAMGAACDALGM